MTRVAEFVIFEDFGVVVEVIGKVEVVVIPKSNRIEGTELLGELEHTVVFFNHAGLAIGG